MFKYGSFSFCVNLESIIIPKSVELIETRAFSKCKKLNSITFSKEQHITVIKFLVFSHCYNLKSISIPKSVETIESRAFYKCRKLKSVIFSNESSLMFIGRDSFSICNNLESIIIPKSIKSINGYTFYYCKKLRSILIPNLVESIGKCAFTLSGMESIEFSYSRRTLLSNQMEVMFSTHVII